MINVVALREGTNGKKHHVNFSQNYDVNFESIEDLIQNRNKIILKLELAGNDHNIYFTVAENHLGEARAFKRQWVLPFDIDNLDFPSDDPDSLVRYSCEVVSEACKFLELDFSKVLSVFSGNGVQFFVKILEPITYPEFFNEYRESYSEKCRQLEKHLKNRGYECHLDTSVFSANRIMRMPDTWNIKPNKPKRKAVLLNADIEPYDLTWLVRSESDTHKTGDMLVKYPEPDSDYVEDQCLFLVKNKQNPNLVSEPLWYADIGVRAFLHNGPERVHAASSGYTKYDPDETDRKIEQAMQNAGPRTCKNISSMTDICKSCPHFGKVVSPITLRGPNYISSKNNGFREMKLDKNGEIRAGQPHYDDLLKLFAIDFNYKVEEKSREVYIWNRTQWEPCPESVINAWAYEKVHSPSLRVSEAAEFVGRVRMNNVVNIDFFEKKSGYINFKNGVYSVQDYQLFNHSPEFGMTYTLPHEYDPTANSPLFDQFMADIFEDRDEVIDVMLQYLGYCISGADNWLHKCLFLIGSGANGKSTLIDTISAIVGEKNVANVPLQKIGLDTYKQRLHNKLFNFSEETAVGSLMDSSDFKALISGGRMVIKELYKQPTEVRNSCKFICAFNEMPFVTDLSYGVRRRFLMIEMRRSFKNKEARPNYQKELVKEASGIFNKLIAGYSKLLKAGYLPELEESELLADELIIESNPVADYFYERLAYKPKGEVLFNEVYQDYVTYCALNGVKPLANNHFSRKLVTFSKGIGREVRRGRDQKSRFYLNITFKNNKGSDDI